jgi:hypothetical protein
MSLTGYCTAALWRAKLWQLFEEPPLADGLHAEKGGPWDLPMVNAYKTSTATGIP